MTTMMMMTTTTTTRMTMTTTWMTMTTRVTQLWNLIEARGFIKDISNNDDDDADNDDDNDNKHKKNNTIPNQIYNTKMDITWSFLKLQAPDLAW